MAQRKSILSLSFHGLMPRVVGAFLAITLGVQLISALLLNEVTRSFLIEQVEVHLQRESRLLLEVLDEHSLTRPNESLSTALAALTHEGDLRITVINADGDVVADSQGDAALMESHADRPEVTAALEGTQGRAVRFSSTLGVEMLYLAFPVETAQGPVVVRTAVPTTAIEKSLLEIRGILLRLSIGTLAAAALLSFLFSRHVVQPLKEMTFFARRIARGQFDPPIKVPGGSELGELATAFNTMARRLEQSLSELSEQRAYLQAVVGSMAEGVIAVDSSSQLILVNPAAQQMLGLIPEEVLGRQLEDVLHLQSLVLALKDTLKTEKGHLVELELDHPTRRIVRAHTAALKGSGPYVGGALGLIYDITELRHLERVRTDFVANVSHELRTPLTSIHGFSETLLDGADEDPETRRRFLQIINRETERVTAIINDLLDLSRLESDKLEVNWSVLTLRRLIEETLPLVADVAEQKQITLHVNVDPEIRVRADEALLRQVFINLLDNAVKYTPDSGGRVTVDAQVHNRVVQVSLTDTGIGIPPADLPRIFERFYRVDRARSRQLGGTGLGLSIVRHIVERLGGSIYAESEPGKGTRMIFTLQKADEEQ